MTAYIRATSLDHLISRAASGARIAAGCTDLFPATQASALPGPVVDLTQLPELRVMARIGTGWRIGAAVTWSEIADHPLPPAYGALQDAAREVGGIQIQNAGTIGGNLCNASPAADGLPPLLALGARVELVGPQGRRILPLESFLLGPRETALAEGEVLTAVILPTESGASGFAKLGARRHLVISIAMAAVRLELDEAGLIRSAAAAVGSCSPVARRLPVLEAALIGCAPRTAASVVEGGLIRAALAPLSDIRSDAEFRYEAAVKMLRRSVDRAAERLA